MHNPDRHISIILPSFPFFFFFASVVQSWVYILTICHAPGDVPATVDEIITDKNK